MNSSKNEDHYLPEEGKKIFDIMRILTILLDGENQEGSIREAIPSSIYLQQMSFTTEKRTATSLKQEHANKLMTDHPSVKFRASPKIVVFQQFFPGNTYKVTLVVKSISSVSQCLKITSRNNRWFTVERKDATCSRKLAPGMSVVHEVAFFPEDQQDHEYQVLFDAGTETFAVPVYAIGFRPLLNFPDVVEVPRTAVKIHSSTSLLVRNIGHAPAIFHLSTNRPFAVQPRKGILCEGETMQVTVDFLSNEKGYFEEKLLVVQETGEIVSVDLRGLVESCGIKIERGTVIMEATYLGTMRSKTFAIHNDSGYVSNFRWASYEDDRRDRLEIKRYETSFEIVKNIDVGRKVNLEHYNICDSSIHESVCQRVFADELSCMMYHTFPFRHPNYRLIPLNGEICPHGTAVVTLIFEPDKIGTINGEAYLETTGYEKRIRLNLHGTCVGPSISLNITCADLGCIFLCSKHNCEVICGNKGEIPGTIVYSPCSSDFGGKIIVTPVRLKLEPGEFKTIIISFWSNRSGDFMERVDFIVEESLDVISLRVKGSVIRPVLHFDKQSLDFGATALGFGTKRNFGLHNSSFVSVTFGLSVMQDGTQPALTHEEFARSMTKSTLAGDPKEFTIVPTEGVVAPDSFQRIEVTYTPNVVRSGQTAIKAAMWDSETGPVTLPVTFSGKVAAMVVRPSEILIKFCFINVPYTRTITIENNSEVEGYFYLTPQSVTVNTAVVYSLSLHQGYLKPCESRTISLKIITTAMGRQKAQLSLHIFGERTLVTCCTLICNGQGPVVTVQPTQLNWGQVRLLHEVKATITLFSDSPIPAQFNARLRKKHSPWTVRPSFGSLEPNESLEIEVSVCLHDSGKYSDRVEIEIANGRLITCSLSAVGVGTSIDLNPIMIPVFDMGLLFRSQNTSVPITMMNKGTKHHRLAWTTVTDFQSLPKSGTYEQQRDKFTIEPHIVELPPNASVIVQCKIRWEANESVEEQWYLYGQIQGQRKWQVLGASLFTATFTDPKISFSKRKLIFRYEVVASDTETQLRDTLCMTNRSGLDLKMHVNIDSPFEIVPNEEDDGIQSATIALRDGVEAYVSVRFNVRPIDLMKLHPRIIRRTLTFDHGTGRDQDKIECVAKLNYPNLSGLPKNPLNLACEVGSTMYKNVLLVNTGDLSVHYRFESFSSYLGCATTPHNTLFLQSRQSRHAKKSGRPHIQDHSITSGARDRDGGTCGGEAEVKGGKGKSSATESLFEQESPKNDPNDGMMIYGNILCHEIGRRRLIVSIMEDKSDSTAKISTSDQSVVAVMDKSEPEDRFGSIQFDNIRDFIFPIVEIHVLEDTEIALEIVPGLVAIQIPAADELEERETGTEVCPIVLGGQELFHDRIAQQILEVVPSEGSIPRNSSQYVYFQLDGSQCMRIGAKILCHVRSGPSETINIRAMTDVICYSVDKKYIDFHRQLFFELCHETVTIVNGGTIDFAFQVHRLPVLPANKSNSDGNGITDEPPDTARLTIEPTHGVVRPASTTRLEITCYPGIVGPIRETFDLEIGHDAPISIRIEGYRSLPQTYLSIRRGESFECLPIDVCYEAIGTLTAQFLVDVKSTMPICRPTDISERAAFNSDLAASDIPIPELERERLTANGWELISGTELLPTPVDIEMAVERLLTIEFTRQSPYTLVGHDSAVTKRAIPSLFVPEYIIELGYVVIERVASYSAMLFNYGPGPAEVRLATARGKSPPKYSGVAVQFCNRKSLSIGESTPLIVTFHPRQANYSNKRTNVEYTFHLEVIHGALIPIRLRAVATYPSLTADTAHVAFGEVAVAHCSMIPVLLRNDGWVPCRWKATIRCENHNHRSDEGDGPFFLRYSVDTFSPCHENVVNVYFRPTECRYFKGQLSIQVDQSIFPILVTLSGTGIQAALRLSEELLSFEPMVPYTRPSAKVLLVENVHSHPVEVFWRNFDTNFIEENRVIRILTHYYGVDEILFPSRQPGEKLSPIVYHFYQTLVSRMKNIITSSARSSEEMRAEDENEDQGEKKREKEEEQSEELSEQDAKEFGRIGTECNTDLRRATKRRKAWQSSYDLFYDGQKTDNSPELLLEDPDRMENLLHLYIDELRETEARLGTTKDPMEAAFEDAQIELSSVDSSSPLRRHCIIVHGAPFTEYRRYAYRLSNVTDIPVFNITNAILEVIAAGNSVCSDQLREIVDENYCRLLAEVESYRAMERDRSSLKTPVTTGNGDADTNTDAHVEAIGLKAPAGRDDQVGEDGDNGTRIRSKLYAESDVFDELNNIPRPVQTYQVASFNSVNRHDFSSHDDNEERGSIDPSDGYAYKVQFILLVQKIMSTASTAREEVPYGLERNPDLGSASRRGDNPGTKRLEGESTFLGIDYHLFSAALKQRLSMRDYRLGFILESLDNIFMKNERDTLIMLLSIVGNVDKLLFITFYNSLNSYLNEIERLAANEEMEAAQKLQDKLTVLEKMTWANYKSTSEENKSLYASNTLACKRADSLRRRVIYSRNLLKAVTKRKVTVTT